MAKPDYGKALDELEALHRAGRISDARYELHKQKLLAEATKGRLPLGVRILIFAGLVIVGFLVLRIIGSLTGALLG